MRRLCAKTIRLADHDERELHLRVRCAPTTVANHASAGWRTAKQLASLWAATNRLGEPL